MRSEHDKHTTPHWCARRMPVRDTRLAALMEGCYRAELCAVATYTYRSLITEPYSRDISNTFDRIAVDESEHFRLIGSLMVSLGGDPIISTRLQIPPSDGEGIDCQSPARALSRMLKSAMMEERREIDRYQTLMGKTEDRIVRSFLSQIIADEERHVSRLNALM